MVAVINAGDLVICGNETYDIESVINPASADEELILMRQTESGTMTSETVQIHGLKELNAKLKRMAARDANQLLGAHIQNGPGDPQGNARSCPKGDWRPEKNLAYSIKRDLRGAFAEQLDRNQRHSMPALLNSVPRLT